MLGMSSVTVSSIRNGIDGDDGVGIASTTVQYACGGSSTTPPAYYLTDQNGAYLVDENGVYLINGEWQDTQPDVPPGFYLWARTVTKYDDGKESCTYSIAREGIGVIKEQRQYYVSSSILSLEDGYWTYEAPTEIPDGYYLWERVALQLDDGSISYSDAVFQSLMSDVMFNVDKANKQIESKVWEDDISGQISEYDKSCVLDMSHKETYMQQTLYGIWTSITDQNTQTVVAPDGSTVTTMASRVNKVENTAGKHEQIITEDIFGEGDTSLNSIATHASTVATQTADHLSWVVKSGTSASDFTLTDRTSSLTADYINNNGLVTFNGLDKTTVRDRIGKSENILSTWTGDATLATTTINGGFIDTHTIVAKHLATSAIQSYGTKNSNGTYTGEYSRTKNQKYSTIGSLFDMSNGNIFTPSFSVINVVPSGETNLTVGAYFKGNVVAESGSIGGWTIGDGILYYATNTPGSTSMILKPSGIAATGIAGQTSSKTWAFTIKDKFGVATDGVLYSTGADITGKITATTGTIGGININSSYGIYTGTKQRADSTESGFLIQKDGGIYLGKYNSTRGSTAFQVNPEGYVKAYDIHAYGGDIGGWNITSSALYSGTTTTTLKPASGRIILSPSGITPSPAVNVGGSGTASKTWTITAGTKFGVTTAGELWCQDANISGIINATAGMIGDCEIINGHLNVGSASIDSIDGSKITAGTISADRISINNLGDLSTALGSITSGSMAWSSGSGSSYTAFGVNSNGKLTATSAEISGKLTAGAGSRIGPWLISATSISKNNGDNNTVGVSYCTSGDGNMYFGDDGISISNVFYVSKTGKLTSTSAEITGSITADTLKFKDSNTGKTSNIIKAIAIEDSETVDVRIGQNGTTGTYIRLCYAGGNEYGSAITDPGQIKISAPNGLKVVNNSDVEVDGNVELLSGYTLGADYIDVNEITVGTSIATIKSESLEDGSPRIVFDKHIKATDIYATGSYRIFYWKDSSHPNATLQCVETNTPNYFGNPKGIQGTQNTWIRFGSTHSYNCMAMPIGGSDIFFHVGGSWYKLKEDIIDQLGTGGGGGTTYTEGTGITIGSDNKININTTWMSNNYATKTHSHSGYVSSSSLGSAAYWESYEFAQTVAEKNTGSSNSISLTNGEEYLVLVHRPNSNNSSGAYLVRGGNSSIQPIKDGSNLTVTQNGTTLTVTDSGGTGTVYVVKISR